MRNDVYAYFEWLLAIIGKKVDSSKSSILEDLFNSVFYSILPNDDNREIDGFLLRERYFNETGIKIQMEEKCTFLEMLVGLSFRMDDILYDNRIGSRVDQWFDLLLDNLNLYNNNKKLNKIIIKKLLQREYAKDGSGSLFPLFSLEKDQRNQEIWYQMMDYIQENNL